ncbi:hypothetical protein [Nocardia carnea]|uniref:hypothetical protein n=1 Tax=Nocardia carnea TaxID=37328 RepID=UPI002457F733|nr:hypothetical protein [Nocardia carnea]
MAKEKYRTKRLGRVHEDVYTSIREAVDREISDTDLIADLLALLTGHQNLAEKLKYPADIAPMCDLRALQALVVECERIQASRGESTVGQAELPLNAALCSAEVAPEALARAS